MLQPGEFIRSVLSVIGELILDNGKVFKYFGIFLAVFLKGDETFRVLLGFVVDFFQFSLRVGHVVFEGFIGVFVELD